MAKLCGMLLWLIQANVDGSFKSAWYLGRFSFVYFPSWETPALQIIIPVAQLIIIFIIILCVIMPQLWMLFVKKLAIYLLCQ